MLRRTPDDCGREALRHVHAAFALQDAGAPLAEIYAEVDAANVWHEVHDVLDDDVICLCGHARDLHRDPGDWTVRACQADCPCIQYDPDWSQR